MLKGREPMARKLNEAEKGFILANPHFTPLEIREKCNKEVSVREIEVFLAGVQAAQAAVAKAEVKQEEQPSAEYKPDLIGMMKGKDNRDGIVVMTKEVSEITHPVPLTDVRDVLRPKKVLNYAEKHSDKIHRIRK
jgi:hypothetical protein